MGSICQIDAGARQSLPRPLESMATVLDPTSSQKRDWRLDFFRGLCLIIMTINHLPSMPLHRLTYETLGYISSAEGFVLISGITSGWVYGKAGVSSAKRIFRRCAYILLTYSLLVGVLFGLNTEISGVHPQWRELVLALGGKPVPFAENTGILLLYLLLFLLLPFVLREFERGRAALLLCVSFGLWGLAQWRIGPSIGLGYVLAWQFLFIAGTWFGYARRRGIRVWGFLSPQMFKAIAAGFALLLFLRHPMIVHPILNLGWWITSKEGVGIVRLVDIGFLAILLANTTPAFGARLAKLAVCRAGCFLGQHSLQVFAWQVLVMGVSGMYSKTWADAGFGAQLMVTSAVVGSLFLAAWVHVVFRRICVFHVNPITVIRHMPSRSPQSHDAARCRAMPRRSGNQRLPAQAI